MSVIGKILIANRGEIACRVIRTARALGIKTVAVYSDADKDALHVKEADEAVYIGPSPATQSYLVIEAIVEAAKTTGADAIHPGYGFLSENAAFAKACQKAKLIFIGPPEKAIDVMGDKAKAKRAMVKAGVPCVPGYQGKDQDEATLIAAAEDIGFPVMVKAAAGGGGRGMRQVAAPEDLPDAVDLARSEAERSFGVGTLILEKAITAPRHVEIQIMADMHGHVVHFGERDCSVQRRHQKVIEEAPCPVMTPELRAAMGQAATDAARAVNYCGAGTVEFLLDGEGSFYFLEMNTRLQVEHPVTEAITGLDLVALQIAVAQGEVLALRQEDITLNGHAIEVRLYAEDPAKGFLPSTGPVRLWHWPEGPGIRVDDGVRTGDRVSPFYDAMVAKIIAYGPTRETARRRLLAALQQTALFGVKSNRDFLIDALTRPSFVAGEATTAFIPETYGKAGYKPPAPGFSDIAAGIALDLELKRAAAQAKAICVAPELLDWSSTQDMRHGMHYQVGKDVYEIEAMRGSEGYLLTSDAEEALVVVEQMGPHQARLKIDNHYADYIYQYSDDIIHLSGTLITLTLEDRSRVLQSRQSGAVSGRVAAPMHGKLISLAVKPGDKVRANDTLAILEAMKMQHEILAPVSGTVKEIAAKTGVQIAADDLILHIQTTDGDKR